ncbi:MAG: RIP metalloprotease RseP [Candidatus Melainabacteria bacterium HGW-Melainabacteria-1]|nr:MAG: RIP metalloprotease RseP [Candidatus Melainabacteria bacterium HGW-Melainabacteria-1]
MSLVHILLVVLVLALLIAFHEFGHFICAKSLGVPVKIFSIGFPMGSRPLFSFRWGETDVQLNPLPLGGFCAFMDDENSDDQEAVEDYQPGDKRFLKNRKIWERAIIISGGVVANMIVAYFILFGLVLGTGVPDPTQTGGVMVGSVIENSPAAAAGLKPGDQIQAIGGQPTPNTETMQKQVKGSQSKVVEVTVKRLNETLTFKATPSAEGTIGVQISDMLRKRPVSGIGEAITRAWTDMLSMFTLLADALWRLFSGALPLNQVGGLVEVVHMGSKVSQTGFTQLMYFAALISIELAILNILPIPALDGGHLMLLVIEALRGKPLSRSIEEKLHYTGFILLIGLGVFLIFKDVWGLTLGRG